MNTTTHSASEPLVPESWLIGGLILILAVYSFIFYAIPALHSRDVSSKENSRFTQSVIEDLRTEAHAYEVLSQNGQ